MSFGKSTASAVDFFCCIEWQFLSCRYAARQKDYHFALQKCGKGPVFMGKTGKKPNDHFVQKKQLYFRQNH